MKQYTKPLLTLLSLLILALAVGLFVAGPAGPADAQEPAPAGEISAQEAIGVAFTYQGRLLENGTVISGTYDFQFRLYNAVTGGSQVGLNPATVDNVQINDGYFSVNDLNFGTATSVFNQQLWLEISLKKDADTAYTTLAPRQKLNPVPYALYSSSTAPVNTTHNHLGETWSGNSNPLQINGSFIGSTFAPLILTNSGTDGRALILNSNSVGLDIKAAGGHAINIESTQGDGVLVNSAVGNGITVKTAQGDGISAQTSSAGRYAGHFTNFATNGNGLYTYGQDADLVLAANGSDNPGRISTERGDSESDLNLSSNDEVFIFLDQDGSDAAQLKVYNSSDNEVMTISEDGNLWIDGDIEKSGGSFKIDHPLDPAHKYLYHSFVESPDMMNIYNGNVTLDAQGKAEIELPDWFEALNQEFRYQLTPIGAPGPNLYIAKEINGNHFTIAGGEPGMRVSWQVTGIRHDPYAEAHRIVVEKKKPADEWGTYLHPELYGLPAQD